MPPTPELELLSLGDAAALPADEVVRRLESHADGLTAGEATSRLQRTGPNAVRSHHARPFAVLARQVRSPLMGLLVASATVSFFVGQRTDAVIIGVILSLSVALGFVNEYRAERAAEALHEQLRYRATVNRSGTWSSVDVTSLVPGDVVRLTMGSVVPADVRIISEVDLECDESVLTGEAEPARKTSDPVAVGTGLDDLSSCAFLGTIVRNGSGEAVVVATGGRTEFGRIAVGLGERHEETAFQAGLRRFSGLLAVIAGVLTTAVFVINVVLHRPLIDALLFSLAIAVGITPQLLPAVVTTSLAVGSRQLAARKVLVKRLVCIEDLGDIDVLLTDKTGTLTEGHIAFERSIGVSGATDASVFELGLACNEAVVTGATASGNALDVALWDAASVERVDASKYRTVAMAPFDHVRRRVSAVIDGPSGRLLVVKGAPEDVLACCTSVPGPARATLDGLFADARRVLAVASRPAAGATTVTPDDEHDLALDGYLVFLDRPKATASAALERMATLGIQVKVVTGDNATVAERLLADLGVPSAGTLTGAEIEALDDDELRARLPGVTLFARVSPEQKSRIIVLHRHADSGVAYLGDGVNDAVALHHADVGISVESATDVARDAADVVLLEKDLGVLADGVIEGRRTFANTIKYVLMGTSSNFGNMFSAAAASAVLKFLPMLPSQILLNNLLYDATQLTIPTDTVDAEQLTRPSHWDLGFIRRFMVFFGPISSLFDFMTFAIMIGIFHAGAARFRSGWFVESLATQTLVIFVIRTRRVPFFRSRPSHLMVAATAAAVAVAALLPMSPIRSTLGFGRLPLAFFAMLAVMVVAYLGLAELGKYEFYSLLAREEARRRRRPERRVQRRAAAFSHGGSLR